MTLTTEGAVRAAEEALVYPVPSVYDDFERAEDLADLAEELIVGKHVDRLGFLQNFDLVYMWKAKGSRSAGRAVLGKAMKLTGYARALSGGADGLVWLSAEWVKGRGFTRRQVEVLLFHELLHFVLVEGDPDKDQEDTLAIAGHELEMFHAEVERYGLWEEDLRKGEETFRQLRLGLGDGS